MILSGLQWVKGNIWSRSLRDVDVKNFLEKKLSFQLCPFSHITDTSMYFIINLSSYNVLVSSCHSLSSIDTKHLCTPYFFFLRSFGDMVLSFYWIEHWSTTPISCEACHTLLYPFGLWSGSSWYEVLISQGNCLLKTNYITYDINIT